MRITACRPGQIVVDLSTSSPSSTVELHARLAESGVDFVDAGISGGAAAAEQGTLTVMAGGRRRRSRRSPVARDVQLARRPHGSERPGHTAKLLNNFLNGVSLAATAEVMVAARKAGLDLRTFLDVLNDSSGVNFATLNRFPKIVDGDYLEGGLTGNLMLKDLRLYRDLVDELGVRPSTRRAASRRSSSPPGSATATRSQPRGRRARGRRRRDPALDARLCDSTRVREPDEDQSAAASPGKPSESSGRRPSPGPSGPTLSRRRATA